MGTLRINILLQKYCYKFIDDPTDRPIPAAGKQITTLPYRFEKSQMAPFVRQITVSGCEIMPPSRLHLSRAAVTRTNDGRCYGRLDICILDFASLLETKN